ncbi:MAG: DNA-binding response regulator [Flavobacteriia bacterium 40-80]|nr:MAG: DNA-binding response regulator [Flavobacteriia bacterium 40-80]
MNKKVNYLIIDDERLAREELKSLLKKEPGIELAGEASNAIEALELIRDLQPDLIFLDIQMPGMTGLDMLKKLEEIPQVIFTTAYDEYAIKAFEVDALDYLLKPIDPARLEEALKKISIQDEFETKMSGIERMRLGAKDKVFIKDGDKCWLIEMEKIRYFESEGNYVKVHFDNFRPMILRSLNALEEKLDPNLFFRANRRFIVNLNYVKAVENWFNGGLQFTLSTDEKIEVSRRQSIKFKDQFGF